MVVRHEQPPDLTRVQTVSPQIRDYLLAAVEPGVYHPELVAGVDDVAVGVEIAREIEAGIAATYHVELMVHSHVELTPPGGGRRQQSCRRR